VPEHPPLLHTLLNQQELFCFHGLQRDTANARDQSKNPPTKLEDGSPHHQLLSKRRFFKLLPNESSGDSADSEFPVDLQQRC